MPLYACKKPRGVCVCACTHACKTLSHVGKTQLCMCVFMCKTWLCVHVCICVKPSPVCARACKTQSHMCVYICVKPGPVCVCTHVHVNPSPACICVGVRLSCLALPSLQGRAVLDKRVQTLLFASMPVFIHWLSKKHFCELLSLSSFPSCSL